jgi:hypothetical protein
LHSEQQHTYRQLLRDELELLRRLSIARRSASTRLPILRRTGLPRLPTRNDFDYNASNKEGPGFGRALVGHRLTHEERRFSTSNSEVLEEQANGAQSSSTGFAEQGPGENVETR